MRAAAKVEIPAGVVGLGLGVAVKKQRDVGGMLRSRLARSEIIISRAVSYQAPDTRPSISLKGEGYSRIPYFNSVRLIYPSNSFELRSCTIGNPWKSVVSRIYSEEKRKYKMNDG